MLSGLKEEMPKSEGKSKRALIESDSDDEDDLEEVRLGLNIAIILVKTECQMAGGMEYLNAMI